MSPSSARELFAISKRASARFVLLRFTPEADICSAQAHVRFASEQRRRPECPDGRELIASSKGIGGTLRQSHLDEWRQTIALKAPSYEAAYKRPHDCQGRFPLYTLPWRKDSYEQ